MSEFTKVTWAEFGNWGTGPALLLMQGVEEDGQLVDTPDVLHDEDIEDDDTTVRDKLAEWGYREAPDSTRAATGYGVVIKLEEWT